MSLVDGKGRLFGKVNVIDLGVVIVGGIFIFCFVFASYKVTQQKKDIAKLSADPGYNIFRNCPNCGFRNVIRFDRGEPLPDFYEIPACPHCGCKVALIDERKEPVKPKPTNYVIYRICPNCKNKIPIKIKFGEPVPSRDYEMVCPVCKNKIIPIEPIDHEWLYYKQ